MSINAVFFKSTHNAYQSCNWFAGMVAPINWRGAKGETTSPAAIGMQ
jgi:hypothetical protein